MVAPAANAPAAVVIASAGLTVMDAVTAVLVVSLTLVAVTVTAETMVLVAVSVVPGAFPVALAGETVPAPVAAKVAPEALPSLVMDAARASAWPESSVMPVVAVVNAMEMGVSVTVAEADFVVSVLLVAVTVAEVVVMIAGAV